MKKTTIIISSICAFILLTILIMIFAYFNSIKKLNNNSELREFVVSNGNTYYTIIDDLYDQKFIKSKLGFKIYLKLNKPRNELKAGKYKLSSNMSVKQIVKVLEQGGNSAGDNYKQVTFKEGLNMRGMIKVIINNFDISEDEIYLTLKDNEYLDELINKYWFLTDEIKNEDIYYSLEGYLAPNTYQIYNDATFKNIIEILLNQEEKILDKYKDGINKSNYSVHEVLTMASIVELEAKTKSDRQGVAGVFYNRMDNNMTLGSDVTTYYASKVDMSERDLYIDEINEYNAYNTRNSKMAGKLPVGPIDNPSEDSIYATLNPTSSDNLYFVSDNKGKVYFAKSYNEHLRVISELKEQGLWERY